MRFCALYALTLKEILLEISFLSYSTCVFVCVMGCLIDHTTQPLIDLIPPIQDFITTARYTLSGLRDINHYLIYFSTCLLSVTGSEFRSSAS